MCQKTQAKACLKSIFKPLWEADQAPKPPAYHQTKKTHQVKLIFLDQ